MEGLRGRGVESSMGGGVERCKGRPGSSLMAPSWDKTQTECLNGIWDK
jgi:hypothetical protein